MQIELPQVVEMKRRDSLLERLYLKGTSRQQMAYAAILRELSTFAVYFRSQKRMCERLRIPRRTLQRSLKHLESIGIVLVTCADLRRGGVNNYSINWQEVQRLVDAAQVAPLSTEVAPLSTKDAPKVAQGDAPIDGAGVAPLVAHGVAPVGGAGDAPIDGAQIIEIPKKNKILPQQQPPRRHLPADAELGRLKAELLEWGIHEPVKAILAARQEGWSTEAILELRLMAPFASGGRYYKCLTGHAERLFGPEEAQQHYDERMKRLAAEQAERLAAEQAERHAKHQTFVATIRGKVEEQAAQEGVTEQWRIDAGLFRAFDQYDSGEFNQRLMRSLGIDQHDTELASLLALTKEQYRQAQQRFEREGRRNGNAELVTRVTHAVLPNGQACLDQERWRA